MTSARDPLPTWDLLRSGEQPGRGRIAGAVIDYVTSGRGLSDGTGARAALIQRRRADAGEIPVGTRTAHYNGRSYQSSRRPSGGAAIPAAQGLMAAQIVLLLA